MKRTCPVCMNKTKVPSTPLVSAPCEVCESELRLASPLEAPHPVLFLLLTCFPWLREVEVLRTKDVRCSQCGYNLVGNASGVCPECGTEISEKYVNRNWKYLR